MTRNGILIDLTEDEDAPVIIRNGREKMSLRPKAKATRKPADEPIIILDDDEPPNLVNEIATLFPDACLDYIRETLSACEWSAERASVVILDSDGNYPRKNTRKRKREQEDEVIFLSQVTGQCAYWISDTEETFECGICFTESSSYDMGQCLEGHLFCNSCMKAYVESLIGESATCFFCLAMF